ncbi:MAG: hypothetical protein AAFP97_01995 [Pseudomonadota bacterium]
MNNDGTRSGTIFANTQSPVSIFIWIILAGIIALLVLLIVMVSALYLDQRNMIEVEPAPFSYATKTPMMGVAERFECPVALQKHILWLGNEDGFDRSTPEPARPRKAVLEQSFFQHVYAGQNRRYRFRDYDELGVDRVLYDTVQFPKNVVSGFLLARVIIDDPMESDFIAVGDLTDEFTNIPTSKHRQFFVPLRAARKERIKGSEDSLITVNFDQFVSRGGKMRKGCPTI